MIFWLKLVNFQIIKFMSKSFNMILISFKYNKIDSLLDFDYIFLDS